MEILFIIICFGYLWYIQHTNEEDEKWFRDNHP